MWACILDNKIIDIIGQRRKIKKKKRQKNWIWSSHTNTQQPLHDKLVFAPNAPHAERFGAQPKSQAQRFDCVVFEFNFCFFDDFCFVHRFQVPRNSHPNTLAAVLRFTKQTNFVDARMEYSVCICTQNCNLILIMVFFFSWPEGDDVVAAFSFLFRK